MPLDTSRAPPQPFVYQGMLIQDATRLMREVCALRHLSINTEESYTHWLGRSGFLVWGLGQLELVFSEFRAPFKQPVQDASGFSFQDFRHSTEVGFVVRSFELQQHQPF